MTPIGTGYVGLAKESTFGQAVAPSVFIPVNSAEATTDPQNYYPETIRNSRAKSRAVPMGLKHELSLELDAEPSNLGHLLLAALGSVSTSAAASVYTHVFTPANTLPSYTVEKYDTVMTQRISGCKLDTLTLSVEAGGDGVLRAEAEFFAQSVTDESSPAAPAYTDKTPFTFTGITVTKDGTENGDVRSVEISITNGLKDDHYTLRKSRDVKEIPEGMREVTGSIELFFSNKADYQSFLAGEQESLKIELEGELISGSDYNKLTIELPKISYDAYEIPMGGPDDELIASLEFTAVLDSVTGYDVKATLVNGVSSY